MNHVRRLLLTNADVLDSIVRHAANTGTPIQNLRGIVFGIATETIAIIDLYVWWNLMLP